MVRKKIVHNAVGENIRTTPSILHREAEKTSFGENQTASSTNIHW